MTGVWIIQRRKVILKMLLTDFYFMWIVLILAILFSLAAFVMKGLWWLGMIGGFFWLIFGLWGINNSSNPVIAYQRELSIVFIAVGIAIFWAPFAINRRNKKSISEAFDDIDQYGDEVDKHDQEMERLRKVTRRSYRGQS